MHVMFNNPQLYVVSYPTLNAIEVIDKRRGRGTFIRDEAAERFARELRDAVQTDEANDNTEAFDTFIEHYDALMMQPAIYH